VDLNGRVAIVTGASLGIGLAITETLLARGARVAGLARDRGRLEALAARLGDAFRACPCDVGDLDQVKRAIRTAHEHFGAIDILVNNAGIGRFGPVEELSRADWDAMLATNVSGVFHCIREVVPILKARGGGHIVNIVSIAGLVGYPGASGYNATKFALRGLSEALAKELGGSGIRVSAVYPGSTDTTFGGGRPDPGTPAMRPESVAERVVEVLEAPADLHVAEIVLRPAPRSSAGDAGGDSQTGP
jgi:NADP-dependent 3-hydroxy acid dehydrogenase YdfG